MNENENTTMTEQSTDSTPEVSGGRTFTQEEVNRIVAERLARERAKTEPSPVDEREADLKARESRLSCREFIAEMGYPAELLDILDTSDAERFKATVEKLDGAVSLPSKNRKLPRFSGRIGVGGRPEDPIATRIGEAFKPPKI